MPATDPKQMLFVESLLAFGLSNVVPQRSIALKWSEQSFSVGGFPALCFLQSQTLKNVARVFIGEAEAGIVAAMGRERQQIYWQGCGKKSNRE